MGLGRNIRVIRESRGLSQEQLAVHFHLPTETIIDWEEEKTSPVLEIIVELALFLQVNIDELVCGEYIPPKKDVIKSVKNTNVKQVQNHKHFKIGNMLTTKKETEELNKNIKKDIEEHNGKHYEFRSKFTILNYPLLHINIGMHMYEARGIIAIGNIARGMFCIGLYTFGIIAFGLLSIGFVSIGMLSLGAISLGGIAIGYICVGGVAIGVYACGYLAIASRVAIGYDARGYIAVGRNVQAMFGLLTNSEINTNMLFEYLLRQGIPEFIARFLLFFI